MINTEAVNSNHQPRQCWFSNRRKKHYRMRFCSYLLPWVHARKETRCIGSFRRDLARHTEHAAIDQAFPRGEVHDSRQDKLAQPDASQASSDQVFATPPGGKDPGRIEVPQRDDRVADRQVSCGLFPALQFVARIQTFRNGLWDVLHSADAHTTMQITVLSIERNPSTAKN